MIINIYHYALIHKHIQERYGKHSFPVNVSARAVILNTQALIKVDKYKKVLRVIYLKNEKGVGGDK